MGGWDIIVHVMTEAGPPWKEGSVSKQIPLSAAKNSHEDDKDCRIICEIILSMNACAGEEINGE